MCGASAQQTQIEQEQQQFYQHGIQQKSTAWAEDQDILQALQSQYGQIFAKGPSQEGFSPEEKAALNTQVTEGTAQNYTQAEQAIQSSQAAAGGGSEQALPELQKRQASLFAGLNW